MAYTYPAGFDIILSNQVLTGGKVDWLRKIAVPINYMKKIR